MCRATSLLGLLLIVTEAPRASAAESEVARLKQNYEAAVERAVAPIKATYEKELRKVLERETKAGNLAAANETNAELEKLTGKAAQAAPADGKSQIEKPKERYFVKRTWATQGGTQFTFLEDGAGYRQFKDDKKPLTWKITEAGLVETTGEAQEIGRSQTCYFRFESAGEAYFGMSPDAVKDRLTLKK
jgi:hypothetical protein